MSKSKYRAYKKSRVGRFQISLLRKTIIIPAKDECASMEREIVSERACIQYGVKVRGKWLNQQIWCSPDELRDLVNALDGLNT